MAPFQREHLRKQLASVAGKKPSGHIISSRGVTDDGTTRRFLNLARRCCTCLPNQHEEERGTHDLSWRVRWNAELVGSSGSSPSSGASVWRVFESERWDADRMLGIRAVLWSLDGSGNTFGIQVGKERPAEMVPRSPGDLLMENRVAWAFLRRWDFDQGSLSEGCPGCRYSRSGQG